MDTPLQELQALAKFTDENPNPVLRLSPKGEVLYTNPAALKLIHTFGKEVEEKLLKASVKIVEEVLEKDQNRTVEVGLGDRFFQFTAIPIPQAHYVYLYGQDVTEQKRLHQLKDDFIGTVSHELRIPLSIIKGTISNLKDGVVGRLTEKQQGAVETASRNVDRLHRLINDLLDLSRLESGKTRLKRMQVDLSSLLKETVQNFQEAAEKKGIEIAFQGLKGEGALYSDLNMTHQVLNNLLDNAIRFGKRKIILSVARGEGDFFRITVMDDGPGISELDQEDIFKKFKQVNRQEGTGYQGTGLGLAIAREIVERHGGKIWVEGKGGPGSIFHFTMPAYDEKNNFWILVQDALVQAEENQSPLACLGISVQNIDALEKQCGEKAISKMFHDLRGTIQDHVLRRSDLLCEHPERKTLLILSETNAKGGEIIRERLLKNTQAIRCQNHQKAHFPKLQIGLSFYPDQATEPEKLVQLALK